MANSLIAKLVYLGTLSIVILLVGCESTPTQKRLKKYSEQAEKQEQAAEATCLKRKTEIYSNAVAGDADAQFDLGAWYLSECGSYDYNRAVEWLQRAAIQGHQEAMYRIASMYFHGAGILKDVERGEELFRTAAGKGHTLAARTLGDIYYWGLQNVPKDLDEAEIWYWLAAEHGDVISQKRLEKTIREKDPVAWDRKQEEIKQAEKENKLKEKERQRKARIAVIQGKLGQPVGLSVIALGPDVKVEQPTRKRTDASGYHDPSGLGYMLSGASTGVLLGVAAGVAVLEAISGAANTRLSGKEKKDIETAAKSLPGILNAEPIEQHLRQQIVELGKVPDGGSLFTPVVLRSSELGPSRYGDLSGIHAVVEVETLGLGLVLLEKQYRPARFLMSNEVTVKRVSDGEILDRRSLCYVSATRTFSVWSALDGKMLRGEMASAYSRIAEDIQLMLAGELDDDGEQTPCLGLNEKAKQYRYDR